MPRAVNVVLIGDSIRLHAEPFVRASLPSRFRVSSPAVNCRSSHEVLAGLREWIAPDTDVVHLNCGLHDVRHDPGQVRPVTSPDAYAANLAEIFSRLAATGATILWATTTPVDERAHGGIAQPRWHRADIVEYNRRSVELARRFGFGIDDLHGLLDDATEKNLFLADGVHFDRAGNERIGRQIAASIRSVFPDPEEAS